MDIRMHVLPKQVPQIVRSKSDAEWSRLRINVFVATCGTEMTSRTLPRSSVNLLGKNNT
jgi:hypothetical protein